MIRLAPEVAAALDARRPVIALESTLVAHGLPRPRNLAVARELEDRARDEGAVPATVAVVAGAVRVGLDAAALEQVATRADLAKVGARDLPVVVARGGWGATTVASTAWAAARAGIHVLATGGLGGVHRGAATSFDESADLLALATTPITVVCAGVKSVLDVGATLERLETLGVTLVGYRTSRLPGFYLSDAGFPLDWQVDSPAEIAAVARARGALGLAGALVVAQPLPPDEQLDPVWHDAVLADGLALAAAGGMSGKALTPFLLDHFHRRTSGASLEANVRLLRRNVTLASRIATSLAAG